MKTKLLTLALFGILTFGFISCSQEEVAPSSDISISEKSGGSMSSGILERDR